MLLLSKAKAWLLSKLYNRISNRITNKSKKKKKILYYIFENFLLAVHFLPQFIIINHQSRTRAYHPYLYTIIFKNSRRFVCSSPLPYSFVLRDMRDCRRRVFLAGKVCYVRVHVRMCMFMVAYTHTHTHSVLRRVSLPPALASARAPVSMASFSRRRRQQQRCPIESVRRFSCRKKKKKKIRG